MPRVIPSVIPILIAYVATLSPRVACGADGNPLEGILTLASGHSVPGVICDSESSESLRWHGAVFTDPFDFIPTKVSSIKYPAQQPPAAPQGEFAIELINGDILTGSFKAWSAVAVFFDTTHFGQLSIRPDAIRRLYRIDNNPTLLFPNLSGLTGWDVKEGEWHEDGAQIWTTADGATIVADVRLPDLAIVEFELSWSKTPNFVFALGVDPDANDGKRRGWRFESWNRVIAAVREEKDVADVDHVQDLDRAEGRAHLIAYLDQSTGEMRVFRPDGTPSGKIAVLDVKLPRAKRSEIATGIQLINRHGDLRLERLRVSRWNGVLPNAGDNGAADVRLELVSGKSVVGDKLSLKAETAAFVVTRGDETHAVPIADVVAGEMVPGDALSEAAVSAVLQDGSRVSGVLQEVQKNEVTIVQAAIAEPLVVPLASIRTLVFSHAEVDSEWNPPEGRPGRLELAGHKLSGRLMAGERSAEASCLVWLPDGSRTGSALRPDAAGRIVYRDPPPKETAEEAARRQQVREMQLQQQAQQQAEPNLFARLFLNKASAPPPRAAKRQREEEHNLHLRSGDVIPCKVASIDEEGVSISSANSEINVVPHERIKALEFSTRSDPPSLEDVKRQRLLTLPRLQKHSPPTHLLCSRTGDFLRCRLITMDADVVRVEVLLDEIEIPRDRVNQIIWFHPDEIVEASDEGATTPEPPAPATSTPIDYNGLAQVLYAKEKRVTFTPEEVDGTSISGVSDVIGECRFELSDVDQLLFGREIQSSASQLAYHQWRLHPAVKPLIAQDFSEDGEASGTISPLVGQEAPEIKLDLLTGEPFKLSEQKGRIIVLDFWATWCGPCMQTMPLVEEAMQAFDPEQVRLISVNLEERADHVNDVLARHDLNLTVAMDIDGVAGRRYEANAIPQLVVVDKEGRIAHVFVGGGEAVIEQLKTAINELLKL